MRTKKILLAVLLLLLPTLTFADEALITLQKAHVNLNDKAALQRGAQLFVNYCLSCHSANYMRYNRLTRALGLSRTQVIDNLIFTGRKIDNTMRIAMRPADAKRWLGIEPPDLSDEARVRGADWLYTYLKSFYLDSSRPTGVDNLVFPKVAMPDVLWALQGWQAPVYETLPGPQGQPVKVISGLRQVTPGTLTPAQYDREVRDLVTFLVYMGEPVKLERERLGVWVLLFLAVFFVAAYLLKKEYWRDVHQGHEPTKIPTALQGTGVKPE
ncbi:MAG: cytochrome c1 [Betaproteobacteria bacterium]|nr:cytochrome c1 [Betaproteobacteria bacterium]